MADAGIVMESQDFLKHALAAHRTWLLDTIMPIVVTANEAGHQVVKIPSQAVLDRILGKCGSCGTSPVRLNDSDLNHLVAGADPVPVEEEPVDITDPVHALAATPAALMILDDESKSLLRFNIQTFSPELRDQFSQEQRWAFNADNVHIPVREEAGAGGPAVYHILRSEGDSGKRLHISGPAVNRWYCVVRGRGFTGVARGASVSVAATVGVKCAFSVKCGSKAEAEYTWLKHHHQGDTAALSEPAPVRPPERSLKVPLATRCRRAAHIYDLTSSDDAMERRSVIDLTGDEESVSASEDEGSLDVGMDEGK